MRGTVWRRGQRTNPSPNPPPTSVIRGRISNQNLSTSNIFKKSVFSRIHTLPENPRKISLCFDLTGGFWMNDTNAEGLCLGFALGPFFLTVLVSNVGGIPWQNVQKHIFAILYFPEARFAIIKLTSPPKLHHRPTLIGWNRETAEKKHQIMQTII